MDEHRTMIDDDDEISLLELAQALGEHKRVVVRTTLATTTLALLYALLATPIYTARAIILPPQQQQSMASTMLNQLGGLAGLAGAAAGIKSPDDMYVAFFQSHALENDLMQRFALQQHYKTSDTFGTRKALESALKVSSDKKSGLINIDVSDKDPAFAAKLANGAVDALHDLLGHLAVTDAQQRRVFFEQQIQKTETALSQADTNFRALSAKGGLPVTDALALSSVQTSTTLRAQIAAKEVELASLRQFATSQNPDMQRIASELAAMREQLNKLESGGGKPQATNPAGESAIAALRDVKTQQAMLEVFTKQYELARVDEAREGPLLQVVDPATPPEHKSKPKRALIIVLGALAGLFLGTLAAFVRHALSKAGDNPETAAQLAQLKRTWTTGWKLRG